MHVLVAIGIVLLLVFQHRAWFSDIGVLAERELAAAVEAEARQNERLRQRNEVLIAEVAALKSGFDAVEARARSDLGMVKEGESFYLVIDDERD